MCGIGESAQEVEAGNCLGDLLQLRQIALQGGENAFVEQLFTCQAALLRRQGLVLEGLEFRCQVAFGVFQGLPAAIIVGHSGGIGVADFNVEAVHTVVLDLQVADARALAFTRLEFDQKSAAVVIEGAQFVEIGVEAVGDDPTVADQRGWFRQDGATQEVKGGVRSGQLRMQFDKERGCRGVRSHCCQRRAQFTQALQTVAQARQIAWAGAAERDPAGDTFDVGKAAQRSPQLVQRTATVVEQHRYRCVARGWNGRVSPGMVQRMSQQARAHGGDAVVEQAAERRRRLATQGFSEFEIASRRRV